MGQKVTDPELLRQLNGDAAAPAPSGQKVMDPALLAQLNAADGATPGNVPSSAGFDQLMSDSSAASRNLSTGVPAPQPGVGDKIVDSTAATANGLVNGIPIIGPLAQNITDEIGGAVANVASGDYGPVLNPLLGGKSGTAYRDYIDRQRAIRDKTAKAAPVARISGELGGVLTGYGALAKLPGMGAALGFEGPVLSRMLNSGLSQLGIGTADSMVRGEKPTAALTENLAPAGIAALLPGAGAVAKTAAKWAGNEIVRPVATLMNKENEVTTRISKAMQQDRATGSVMTPATERMAQRAGADVVNADRFGSAIRTLARTSSNVNPQADNLFKDLTQDRFHTQGRRAIGFVRQLMGGATDDLALQDSLRRAAEVSNSAAYGRAYASPAARAVWNQPIRELMQSPNFRAAVQLAEARGADKAAVAGVNAVRNPFKFDADGTPSLKMRSDVSKEKWAAAVKSKDKAAAASAKAAYEADLANDGPVALPSLDFWNQVKINLDTLIGQAKPALGHPGDRGLYSDLTAIKTKLVQSLDAQVPAYAAARRGAAGFFGAEDAIDAGRMAFKSPKQVPEIERAVAKANPTERDAMAVGYASELMDAINATRDRVNVINNLFGSESARARNTAVLGSGRARELEAYVKTEQVLDLLRQATQGNSTTAKQLIAAGAIGVGTGLYTGDWTKGFTAGALYSIARKGMASLGKRVDDDVMKRVADILVSGDPAKLQRAIQNASLSQQHMAALDALMRGLSIGARAAVGAAALETTN